ncbi:MAG: hypothetical protein ACRD03_05230 [Acidimicrobiales bacterium]
MSVVQRSDEPGLRLFAVDDDALWDSRPRLSPQEFAMEDVGEDEWDAFYAALTEE